MAAGFAPSRPDPAPRNNVRNALGRLLTIFLSRTISTLPRPLEGRLSRGVAQAGRRRGAVGDAAARPSWTAPGNSGPRPVRRPRAGLANRHSGDGGAPPGGTTASRQELAHPSAQCGSGTSAARRRSENAAMVRRETRRPSRGGRLCTDLVASLGAPFPSLREGQRRMKADPAPQTKRAMAHACLPPAA